MSEYEQGYYLRNNIRVHSLSINYISRRSRQNTAFSFNVDRTSAVRLVNDSDHERLWRQQIQQFKGVGSEIANAIIAAYATPRTLWNVREH